VPRDDKALAAARATPRPDAAVPNIAWARLVERVKAERPAVASVLEHAQVLRFAPDGVELGFAASTFYWESAKDPEVRELLGRMLADQFGQTVRLTLSPLDLGAADAPASLAAAHDESRRRREREIHETAIGHPAVKQAISVLGGEVTAVKPLVDLDDPGHEG
jgi:DNA polymerase-3 subunit gamma/tau